MHAIEVTNLSKSFKIPHDRKIGLKPALLGLLNGSSGSDTFHALKNVNLQVKKGEFLGITGPNGAGKSTLLKLLAGVLQPDTGNIQINGKLSPFLELGLGFNGELTAKENIYIYGTILGLTRRQIKNRFQEIITFAELEKFVHTKLKNFSSGMLARLAFSIAIQVDVDILLVDEVLAVGDEAFQKKCYEVFRNFKKEGKTVILVSHDKQIIKKFSDKLIEFRDGKIVCKVGK
tara:strand:+ start:561 stop:1256 length:696 start_codon:yes stop_codon:yes gene_type:complete